MVKDFLKYYKKILFIGGLWNNKYFGKAIKKQLSRYKNLTFIPCREVKQIDIDKNEVIICYSIAIQYVHKLNLKNKKVILLSPLLNSSLIKDPMIKIANAYMNRFKNETIEQNTLLNFIMNLCGGDKESNKLWWKDIKLWIGKYSNDEKVLDIKPEKNWVIIEGRMPICKLPRIDIKTPYGHLIPISDDYNFLDKCI